MSGGLIFGRCAAAQTDWTNRQLAIWVCWSSGDALLTAGYSRSRMLLQVALAAAKCGAKH